MRKVKVGPFEVDGLPVTIESDSETVEDLRSLINEFTEARDEPTSDEQPDAPDAELLPEQPRVRPWGMMDVSEASGKPGDLVSIELRGTTDVPISGWFAAIGFESNKLYVVNVEFGALLKESLRTEFWRARVRGHPRVGTHGPHIQLAHTGWKLGVPLDTDPSTINPDDPDNIKGLAELDLLPPETVLATIKFRIKPEAKPGVVPLLNRSNWFGKMPVNHVFTRLRKHGITPKLLSGSVTILEP